MALLLEREGEDREEENRGELGICLGLGEELWGYARRWVLEEVTEKAVRYEEYGREVRLLVMNEEEDAAAQHIVDAADERHEG